MQHLSRWKDKVALVTGASTGIGEAVAHSLAEAGMTVVLAGRRLSPLEAVAKVIREREGKALALPCDLGDEESLLAMFGNIHARVGPLDVLINNAGLGYEGLVANLSTKDLRQVMDVNVVGTAICIREAIKQFGNRQDTAVITISSLAAHRTPPGGYGHYAASKHALRALMEALRTELIAAGSPTKIGNISPGTVATDFHKLFSRSDTDPTEALGFQRLLPEDVAQAVIYMMSTARHVQINDILMRPVGQIG
jgi:17beta-estradiol 17-dehydrogenase / 3beta-hydroxysteroid 3-dehydrogenase